MENRASYDFSGRVAVITGGGTGIGAAIATHLRSYGATVIVWDLDPGGLPEEQAIAVDVSDPVSTANAAAETLRRYPKIDILVNNAGYAGPTASLEEYPLDAWQRIMDVNLGGVFHVTRSLLPALRNGSGGRIVNIASLAGKEGTPNAGPYSASKAAVLALTKSWGKELAGSGILVNAIAPAAVRTSLLEQMSKEHVDTMIAKSPLGRLGEPDEVAEMVLWLCSGSCSFNTGAMFDLSGGRATY
ncbi:SDR family NAD(P)-dependent oxidoreductase [Oricola indica]|uniref:SDR family NAD(P)-dependent oxidoreductase n=1 Tax=Oricola indica TaxID=2872591 RepID=UPI003CCBB1E3